MRLPHLTIEKERMLDRLAGAAEGGQPQSQFRASLRHFGGVAVAIRVIQFRRRADGSSGLEWSWRDFMAGSAEWPHGQVLRPASGSPSGFPLANCPGWPLY